MKYIKSWSFAMRRPYFANAEGVAQTLDSWWKVADFEDRLRERAAELLFLPRGVSASRSQPQACGEQLLQVLTANAQAR